MARLNCALVGYGGIAEFHVEALKQIDGVELRTLMGRRADPAKAFADRHGFARSTTSLDEALADDGLDAVILTSPSEVHVQQALACLEAGKHVLVEIPLALSLNGALQIAERGRQAGRQVMVAHTRRFDETGRFVKQFLDSGEAGHVYQHQSYSLWFRHENVGWTGYQRSWVDDVVFHHGCHLVDFSRWTVGAPVRRVRGEISPKHPVNDTSMDVSLLIRYENETMATISLSYNAPQGATGNRYLCEKGVLEIDGKTVRFGGKTVFETSTNPESGVLVQNREFIAAIREGRTPSCDAQDGAMSLAPLQAAFDQMVELEGPESYQRRWEEGASS
ncbi:MAG: Gfo/Idh/MocA family oxidoreductase [Gemmatimonadetes bacterium]|jgi:2-hydroxy-4-carboxymuconate semialdehyde hemiacetal dehydrogenase|nr:Gfo/Idh/MocA family oxidoreductase [Gemmatimonadota bacterium]MBT6146860.1 Gfo/Idh/MocA family oxidoreductase [Gemmatimonadota bacterium]MBT7860861.1 Gfo/Idh/MocA family oxidoreductase [Gemmatimonadota bacterium]